MEVFAEIVLPTFLSRYDGYPTMLIKKNHSEIFKKSAALVVGLTIQGLAIARALSKAGVTVYAVERRKDGPAPRSKYLHFIQRDSLEPEYLTETLLDCRKEIPHENVVIFPCSDKTVRAVAANWDRLQDVYRLSWSGCTELTASFTFKDAIYAHADRQGTLYPRAKLIGHIDETQQLGNFSFPLLVKPDQPPGTFKTRFISSHEQLRELFAEHPQSLPFVVQEWVEGGDDRLQFCTVFMDDGHVVASVTGRKYKSFPPGLGRGVVIELFEDTEVREKAIEFLRGLPLSGPVSVEFKRDKNGVLWLIEPNMGRTEYCVDLIIQSGLNLPYLEYCYTLGLPYESVLAHPLDQNIVWYDTDVDPLCYWQSCLRQRTLKPWNKKPVFPFFGHSDYAPLKTACLCLFTNFFDRAARWIGRRVKRLVSLS